MFATWKQHEGQDVDGVPLLRLLGSGESSAVFLSEVDGQQCAMKLVPTEEVVAQLPLSRWEQASKLSHPHLSRILKWGRTQLDGIPLVYVAMEYAEEELSSVDRPLTPREAREMLYPAAKALAYLHGKGFAHGRIKPPNILSVNDELKISGDAPLRKGERHASSPAPQPYDPPDLAASGVTPAGDVWSLGVALVWAMTKELPAWEGGSLRLPESLKPNPFRDVATGCLERDPAKRWTVADLTQWLERDTVPWRKRARRRYLVPVAAVVGVAAVGAVAWPHFVGSQPADQTSAPVASSAPAPSQPAQNVVPPVAAPEPAPPPPPSQREAKRAEVKPPPTKPDPQPKPSPETKVDTKADAKVDPKPEPSATNVAASVAADVASPDVAQGMIPSVTAKARATIHGKVPITVRVQADAAGAVTSAKVESGASSKYFANMALSAAKQWKFVPGADAREWLVRFEFTHDAEHPVTAKATSLH